MGPDGQSGDGFWVIEFGSEEGFFPQRARKGTAVLTARTSFGMGILEIWILRTWGTVVRRPYERRRAELRRRCFRIIVWVSDTVIVKKQLDGQAYYYVADAVTGQPVAKANVEFFGWKQVQVQPNANQYRVETTQFQATTDADGQLILAPTSCRQLPVAGHRPQGEGRPGRRRPLRLPGLHRRLVRPASTTPSTTRPRCSPSPIGRSIAREQTVQFKFWVRHAKYDQADTSVFAGQTFTVQIHNPKGEKIFEKAFTADAYGGLAGEFPLPKGAMLGVYSLQIVNARAAAGSGSRSTRSPSSR